MALLEMRHISKHFGDVVANDDVSLQVNKGEIHALLGENGAGKSTLMNILFGMYDHWDGEIFFEGQSVRISSPKQAMQLGIGMVHQHFMLIPTLTVIENVILGMERPMSRLNLQRAAQKFSEMAKHYGMAIEPMSRVSELSVGQQQRLEILKALYRNAKLLILDEPTAVLTPGEVTKLFEMIRILTSEGMTVIFISHKLNEIMELCDRCTVLRQGRTVQTLRIDEVRDHRHLTRLMVGHDVQLIGKREMALQREEILALEQVCCKNKDGLTVLKNISLSIHGGEILGICGVDGNGQSELAGCITGLYPVSEGKIRIRGVECTNRKPRDILRMGVSHIPEDRQKTGIVGTMTIEENIIMVNHNEHPISSHLILHLKAVMQMAEEICKEFEIKAPSTKEFVKNLSGGNQQKMVVGRELSRAPKLLVAVHPSRGLDIGATKYIQSRILDERDKGAAVLLISSELEELLDLSDRILVLYEGRNMGIVSRNKANRDRLGLMMGGISQ